MTLPLWALSMACKLLNDGSPRLLYTVDTVRDRVDRCVLAYPDPFSLPLLPPPFPGNHIIPFQERNIYPKVTSRLPVEKLQDLAACGPYLVTNAESRHTDAEAISPF